MRRTAEGVMLGAMDDRDDLPSDPELMADAAEGDCPLAIQLDIALEGAVYPLRRREIVLVARENDAAPPLLTLLSGLPDQIFGSHDDVSERVSALPPPS